MDCFISILGFDRAGDTGLAASHVIQDRVTLGQVDTYFQNSEKIELSPNKRRLFIVKHPPIEDKASTARLRQVLQNQLGVPAGFFQAHRWNQIISRFTEVINFPRLPTAISPRSRFSLEYLELWEVLDDEPFGHHMKTAGTVECVATGRQIQCHKWVERPGWLLIAPRKCSFWSRKHQSGWNGEYL